MRRLLVLLCAVAMCAVPAAAWAAQPLRVVASISILADMVKNVGGQRVSVSSLVGPDSDAHVYEPSPADAKSLAEANLVVVNGLGLEGWMSRLVTASGYKGPLVEASKGVKPLTMEAEEHGEAGQAPAHASKKPQRVTDPHAWQSLACGRIYVANIAQALAQADPQGAAEYQANAAAYLAQIDKLETWVKAQFALVPRAQRKIITTHDAFGYLGAAYGLTLLAPVGVSTEAEPSAAQVGRLIRQIKKEHVRAVFVENITDPRLMERVAKESGAVMGGELYSDALSKPDGPAATYLDMFRHNVGTMVKALKGQD